MDAHVKQQIEHPVEDAFDPAAVIEKFMADYRNANDADFEDQTVIAKVAAGYPDGNPKTAIGLKKPPMQFVPPVAIFEMGQAFKDGAVKYGPLNWRASGVSSTVYYDAMLRHAMSWFDGEDVASDSKVHHLAHVMACCAILIDAERSGTLNDDRPQPGALPAWIKEKTECK